MEHAKEIPVDLASEVSFAARDDLTHVLRTSL
jgi:hypothetical protein